MLAGFDKEDGQDTDAESFTDAASSLETFVTSRQECFHVVTESSNSGKSCWVADKQGEEARLKSVVPSFCVALVHYHPSLCLHSHLCLATNIHTYNSPRLIFAWQLVVPTSYANTRLTTRTSTVAWYSSLFLSYIPQHQICAQLTVWKSG